QSPAGAFGEAFGEEPLVTTYEALLTLRATGTRTQSAAQAAEFFLAVSKGQIDSELELRRQIALASTAFGLSPGSLVTEGPGFEQPDALHLALSLKSIKAPMPTPDQVAMAVQLPPPARTDA